MKLTKFGHSCFSLENDNQTIVFDPGNWSTDFEATHSIVAVVLTHEHADHFDEKLLGSILEKNPNAKIIAPRELTEKLQGLSCQDAIPGETITVDAFTLQFFGGEHAVIHPTIASVVNVGVLVNGSFYYPGDSFAQPGVAIETLALPVTAPWLKISESIDFMLATKPKLAFPVHDHIASDDGKALVDRILSGFATNNAILYKRITGTIEI